MWVFVDGSEVGAVELQDVRSLTWVDSSSDGTRQVVLLGGKISGFNGTTVTGVVPLPVCAGGSSASASASGSSAGALDAGPARVFADLSSRELHGVLEMCKNCFPTVVRDAVLRARQGSDGEDSESESDSDSNCDGSDSNCDGSGHGGGGCHGVGGGDRGQSRQGDMARLAVKHVREDHEARKKTPAFAESLDVLAIMTVEEAAEAVGGGTITAALLEQNQYLGADTLMVVVQWTPASDDEGFALAFDVRLSDSGGVGKEGSLPAFVSTRPMDDRLAGAGLLEPVTRRMDHHLFSVDTLREPAGSGLAGAGKTGSEMLKDMQLRHASGSCTTIVKPHFTLADVAGAMPAPLNIAHAGRVDIRLRRLVGCWNTLKDINFQLA